jgi:hypothetical protein
MARYPVVIASVAAALVVGTTAAAKPPTWTKSSRINTTVHEHSFERVTIEATDCTLKVKLLFTAPESGYHAHFEGQNVYRFRARVKLDDDHAVESVVFKTSTPGRKLFAWTKDTAPEGCWVKDQRGLRAVDVNGCRGHKCEVPSF